jgi:hypothetical protein
MVIGDRLRALREEKKLSQGDIEKRTELLRSYISRVENNHTNRDLTPEDEARCINSCPRFAVFMIDQRYSATYFWSGPGGAMTANNAVVRSFALILFVISFFHQKEAACIQCRIRFYCSMGLTPLSNWRHRTTWKLSAFPRETAIGLSQW